MEQDKLFYFCGFVVECIPAIFANLFVIIVSLRPRLVDGEYKWFILAAAVADFLFCLNCIGQLHILIYPEYLSYRSCTVWGYTLFTFALSTVTMLPLIAFNRYVSLYYSAAIYKRVFRPRNIFGMISAGVAFAALALLPFLLIGNAGEWESIGICGISLQMQNGDYIIFGAVFGPVYLLSYALNVFSNARIYQKLQTNRSRYAQKYRPVMILAILQGSFI